MSFKPKVLIVDDSEINRLILTDMLEDKYDLIEVGDGKEAIRLMNDHGFELSLVLLDYMMPEMDGFEVLEVMRERGWNAQLPVIMISAETGADYIHKAYDLGVYDFISRPFDASIVTHRVENMILLDARQKHLERLVAAQVQEKTRQSNMLINILSHIVEFRNEESGRHVLNVRAMTKLLLTELRAMDPTFTMDDEQIERIALASALHDVGKMSIDEKILNKPGRLTDEEFEQMKRHTIYGAQMLEKVPSYQHDELVKTAIEIARWHHERYDGKGYPDHLVGEQIPISAQVVALADVYDALTEERVYKKAFSPEQALTMILNGECGCFSQRLLRCLERARRRLKQVDFGPDPSASADPSSLSTSAPVYNEKSISNLVYERTKYAFYTSRSQEMRFEYTFSPPVLTLSMLAAHKFNLDSVIADPLDQPDLMAVLGQDNIERLCDRIRQLSWERPECELELALQENGEPHWFNFILHGIFNEEECHGYFGLIVDVHDEKVKREALERSAHHDGLTGLVNKAYAPVLIQSRLDEKTNDHFALMIIDLDNFKTANDENGHKFGDEVLQTLASRITRCIRSYDVAARIGGDEFVVFLQYHDHITPVIDRIFHSIQGEYKGYPIQTSVGVATTETCARDYDVLFETADRLLYEVKKSGKNAYRIDHLAQGE